MKYRKPSDKEGNKVLAQKPSYSEVAQGLSSSISFIPQRTKKGTAEEIASAARPEPKRAAAEDVEQKQISALKTVARLEPKKASAEEVGIKQPTVLEVINRPEPKRAAAEDVEQKQISALKTVPRPDPEYRFLSVGTSGTELPEQFTKLNLPSSSDTNSSITPEKQKQKFVATTVQDALISKLGRALDDKPWHALSANVALGVLTIIPYDQRKKPFSIQITRSASDHVEIVYPNDIFGKPQATFTTFQALRSKYSQTELDKDRIVQNLKNKVRKQLSSQDLGSPQHEELLQSTHHSEQFILAAISNTLNKILSIKDPGLQISIKNSTFLIDISTEFAPCNHCMSAIDDFMNYFRELLSGTNLFVTRISWLKSYRNSFVSRAPSNSGDSNLDFNDSDKNYIITCRINDRLLKQSDQVLTGQGKNASKAAVCISRTRKDGGEEMASNMVLHGEENIADSPIRSKHSSATSATSATSGPSHFSDRVKGLLDDVLARQASFDSQQLDQSFDEDGHDFYEIWDKSRESANDIATDLGVRTGSQINELIDQEAKASDKKVIPSPWNDTRGLLARINAKIASEKEGLSR